MKLKPVSVLLKERSYDIAFGPAAELATALKARKFAGRKALIVSTTDVATAGVVAQVKRALSGAKITAETALIPNGEKEKNLRTLERLYQQGFRAGLDRSSLIVAVGGGVVTDLAGFLAATYMRGIPYVSVPTTVLAMVDASIGGKTGVDMLEGKNLIGSFWQPSLVWVDASLLRSLPERQWRTGFAEIFKYGVIADPSFFAFLEHGIAQEPRFQKWTPNAVLGAIRWSVEIKAHVVGGDEREAPLGGGREILNFGHTSGHALEAATGYRSFSHGEAISVGMAVAGKIAIARGFWSEKNQERMMGVLAKAGLPTRFPKLNAAQEKIFWSALAKDKKNIGGELRFVLPLKIGEVAVESGIPKAQVAAAIKSISA